VGSDAVRPHLLGGDHGDEPVGGRHALRRDRLDIRRGRLFAIVYLGEHYVADVIVGLLVAETVRRAEPLAAPFVRAVARAVE